MVWNVFRAGIAHLVPDHGVVHQAHKDLRKSLDHLPAVHDHLFDYSGRQVGGA